MGPGELIKWPGGKGGKAAVKLRNGVDVMYSERGHDWIFSYPLLHRKGILSAFCRLAIYCSCIWKVGLTCWVGVGMCVVYVRKADLAMKRIILENFDICVAVDVVSCLIVALIMLFTGFAAIYVRIDYPVQASLPPYLGLYVIHPPVQISAFLVSRPLPYLLASYSSLVKLLVLRS